jgi:hypothetical protein
MGFELSVIQRAERAPASAKDFTRSFKDRIVELQEDYDQRGHLRLPYSCTDGRCKDLALWVKNTRKVYHRCLEEPCYLGEESPLIVLIPHKASDRATRGYGIQMVGNTAKRSRDCFKRSSSWPLRIQSFD